jgi:carbonic anhydrase
MFLTIIFLLFFFCLLEDEYNYKCGDSKGPENWGNIKPEWKLCGTGKSQSPIDIINSTVHDLLQLGKLEKDYKPAPAVLKNRGHDVMVNLYTTLKIIPL